MGEEAWFKPAMAERKAILSAMSPDLSTKDGATLFKYTMGQGSTGREREAYVAGWLVVGQLLSKGATLAGLARVPEAQMPEMVGKAVRSLQAA